MQARPELRTGRGVCVQFVRLESWRGNTVKEVTPTSKAAKAFEVFLSSTNDGEIEAAYEALCRLNVGLSDVARHVSGKRWVTLITQTPFELTNEISELLR